MKVDKTKWRVCRLEEICTNGTSNIVISKINIDDNGYPLYGANGLIGYIDFYHQDKEYIGIIKDGSGVGRVAKYPAFTSLVGTMQYIFPKNNIRIDYLRYLLESLHLSKYVTGAAIPHIYFRHYKSEQAYLPPLSEQTAIASELDSLQTVIDGYKAQLADLDALAQSVFLEMFGDPVANDKGWETNLLSEKCKIFGRIGFRGYTKNDFVDTSKDGCITLSPSNIDGLSVTYEKCSYITWHKYDESPEIQIFNGDILVVKTGSSYGKCALVRNLPHPATINPQFVVLKQVKCNNVFLVFLLATKHAKNQYDSFVGGAAIPTFSQANMRKMTFPFPPLPLQTQFASRVEAIEKQKEQIRQQLKDAETLMAERMQYYFG